MSSQTLPSQQLSEAERVPAKALERKIARLEAQVKELESLEVEIEDKNELLREKDFTIEQLQMVIEKGDRPSASGDVNEVETLQSENKALKQKLSEAAAGDQSQAERKLQRRADHFLLRAKQAKAELESAKEEISKLQEYNRVLKRQSHNIRLEAENCRDVEADRIHRFDSAGDDLLSTIESQRSAFNSYTDQVVEYVNSVKGQVRLDNGALNKLEKSYNMAEIRPDAPSTKSTPTAQSVAMQSSGSPSTRPSPSRSVSSTDQHMRGSKTSPKSDPKGKAAGEGTEKVREVTDQGFTAAAKGKTAPPNRGPKQGPFEEQAATSNPFAPLADKEKRTPKLSAQEQKPEETRQPSSGSQSVSKNAEKRDQKPDSASRPQSTRWGPPPASAPAKAPAEPQNQRHVFKPAATTTKNASIQLKTSFNPAATSFAPGSSKSMAQVADEPPKPELEPPNPANDVLIAFMIRQGKVWAEEERNAMSKVPNKSKVPDRKRKRIQDAVVGEVVEPGKRKSKPTPRDDVP